MSSSCPHASAAAVSVEELVAERTFLAQVRAGEAQCSRSKCDHTMPLVWMCCECGFVGCGRDQRGHLLKHSKKAKHSIALNLASGMMWCYSCDDEILDSDESPARVSLTRARATIVAATQPEDAVEADELSPEDDVRAGVAGAPTALSVLVLPERASGSKAGQCGLSNLGNTCFMNAALQNLSNSLPLREYFQRCYPGTLPTKNMSHLVVSMERLMVEMWNGRHGAVAPREVLRDVMAFNPVFRGYGQQDSQELIRCVLDKLHEELKVPWPEESNDEDSRPRYKSMIGDIFGGRLLSRVECDECGNVSLTRDEFFDLSVQLPTKKQLSKVASRAASSATRLKLKEKEKSGGWLSSVGSFFSGGGKTVVLEECLHAYCADEILSGDDKYRCEGCSDLVNARKGLSICELPEVLCIHIKRFKHDSYFGSKVTTPVAFPLENLDMRPFLSEEVPDTVGSLYNLSGIVNHRGGIAGGHYVGYCRSDNDGEWYEFDDSRVSRVSEDAVASTEAYVLFYRKQVPELAERRAHIMDAIQERESEDSAYVSMLWATKYLTFFHPGPIDNADVLCVHGNVNYHLGDRVADKVWRLPRSLCDEFEAQYGGDGAIDNLTPCATCEAELVEMQRRRVREDEEIRSLDTKVLTDEHNYWYLIDAAWLKAWHRFINGGDLPPPISNHRLMRSDGSLRPGLRKIRDYRGVNKRVYKYFEEKYGGGPMMVREAIDIYGEPLPDE